MHGKVFITGATGFVGGELLRRHLRQDPRHVVCLVRAQDAAAARARGTDTLRKLGLPQSFHSKTTWVAGDVQADLLGIARDVYRTISSQIEEIFHCAASTDFDLPLEEAQAINVEGAKRVFGLASAANKLGSPFRRLNHVSTAYVSGRQPGAVTADDLPSDDPANFRNTYEQTKAMAERFLRQHMDELPISVYRPSIVVGDSTTGYTSNWNVVYFPMRLMAAGRLRFAPAGGPALLDCVPVDYVVNGMLALSRQDDTAGGTFLLTAGADALTVHDVIHHTYAGIGRQTNETVKPGTRALGTVGWWCMKTFMRLVAGPKVRKAIDGFGIYEEYCRVRTMFDDSRERNQLETLAVSCRPAADFFPRVVDYALERRFGRQDKLAPVPRPVSTRLAQALQSASGALADALQSGAGPIGSVA